MTNTPGSQIGDSYLKTESQRFQRSKSRLATSMPRCRVSIVFFFLLSIFVSVESVAVMSVDLGSEWMKVAIVSPGVPMEIVLNRESQRKTPVAISFRDGERMIGESALNLAARFPEKVFVYFLDLIGKKIDNPAVDMFRSKFPYYELVPHEETGTVMFKHPEGIMVSPEELVAMILKYAQEIAVAAAGQPIKDAVITVPAFFNQAERKAMIHAAQLAGLNPLQLINVNTAVALHYGVFRRKDFNDTQQNIMFYDMGASTMTATIASYQMVKSKERGFVETNPQVTIRGFGFDRFLGGLDFQLRLRNHFATVFNAQKKTKQDVFKSNRALSKLLLESGRVKKVLSANTETIAQVENLLDDKDFKAPVNRGELEDLSVDLFERILNPVKMALQSSGMSLDDISQVIVVGGSHRVPKVQQVLMDFIKKGELGKSVNADEAASLGSVYQAAYLSKGFRVKTFIVKEANLYPIQVEFQREVEQENGEKSVKTVKRVLFGLGNVYPQKKVMTFARHTNDFEFYVNYGDLSFLNEMERKSVGSVNISSVKIAGVAEALNKHTDDDSEAKGVKARFIMDESGTLTLDTAESVFEKKVEENKTKEEPLDLQATLTKLGNTIGKLFSGSDPHEPEPVNETKPEEEIDANATSPNQNDSQKDGPSSQKPENKREAVETNKTLKLLTIKETLAVELLKLDLPELTATQVKRSKEMLDALDEKDHTRFALDKARNALESFVLETKIKLYMEEYEKASTEKERENILAQLSAAGEWLEYESDNAKTEEFRDKLADLRALTRDLFDRIKEHNDRPEAVKALSDMLNISNIFLQGVKNASQEDQIFTEVEVTTLDKLIEDTKEWLKENSKIQADMPLYEMPKLTVKSVAEKIAALDREVKYMLNKARFHVPKPKKDTSNATESPSPNETIEEEIPAEESEEKETLQIEDRESAELPDSNSEEAPTTASPTESTPETSHSEL